jgi:hypothetical protein
MILWSGGGGFAWKVVLWHVEGLLKWDFSTLFVVIGSEEEEPPMVVLANTMAENYTAWKGYSNMN